MMNDGYTAAAIITDAMAANQFAGLLSNAQARRDYEGDIAQLRAWLDWMERRHQTLVTTIGSGLDVVKAQMAADGRQIAELERENAELRRQNAELAAGKKTAEDLRSEYAVKLSRVHAFGLAGLELPYP